MTITNDMNWHFLCQKERKKEREKRLTVTLKKILLMLFIEIKNEKKTSL